MKTIRYIIPFLILFVSYSCEDGDFNCDTVKLYWAETGCADPWDYSPRTSTSALSKAVGDYLKEYTTQSFCIEIEYNQEFAQACLACHCTIGKIIVVECCLADKEKLIELGFVTKLNSE